MSLQWDLWWAVQKGDDRLPEVERVLAEGVDVNERFVVSGHGCMCCVEGAFSCV
jgi:hypothetical protein